MSIASENEDTGGLSPKQDEQLRSTGSAQPGLPTPLSVSFSDSLMGLLIAIGGIGTIIALLVVVLVLIATTVPLLRPAKVGRWSAMRVDNKYRHLGIDNSGTCCWAMTDRGEFHAIGLANGQLVAKYPPNEQLPNITCSSVSLDRSSLVLGFEDGSVLIVDCEFEEELFNARSTRTDGEIPFGISSADPMLIRDGAVYQWLEGDGIRRIRMKPIIWSRRIQLCQGPITAIDMIRPRPATEFGTPEDTHLLATGIQNEELRLITATVSRPASFLQQTEEPEVEISSIAIRSRTPNATPLKVMLTSGRQHQLVLWPNGSLDRFSTIEGQLTLQESKSLSIGGQRILSATPLLGRQTLCCGTTDGYLVGWTLSNTKSQHDSSSVLSGDGFELKQSHRLRLSGSPLVGLASGQRSQIVAALDLRRRINVCYVTTDQILVSTRIPANNQAQAAEAEVIFNPAGTGLLTSLETWLYRCSITAPHPEASWRTYFASVWYQGHDRPKFIWQSTSADESSEIKLSLIPLLFGTLKATFFTMLISVPIALMAAIYTSEFLSKAARAKVKPVIELMASIPGVVLGYLCAVVIAPNLGPSLIWLFCTAAMLPLLFLFGGRIWDLLAGRYSILRSHQSKRLGMVLLFGLSLLLAAAVSKKFEAEYFGGQFPLWLASGSGPTTGGWLLLLIPSFALLYALIEKRLVSMLVIQFQPSLGPYHKVLGILRPLIGATSILILSWTAASWFDSLGWDLRSSLFTSYQNRNALLVGAALGFGVIPIIFTIADDVFQMFPAAYRNGSLACGATRWQTAMRLVLPASISGLISAIMLGFARAVGETMIVLMVVGNTPLMEWNPFSGLRALTATLATELPEAIKGSTHYRTLFLAAVLLFGITLIANTLAEFLRTYHRRKTGLP